MYRLHYFIGLCCYDREPGLELSIVLVFFPYAGESEKLAVFTDDPIRSFLAIRERLPLVKTICRNKASAFGLSEDELRTMTDDSSSCYSSF